MSCSITAVHCLSMVGREDARHISATKQGKPCANGSIGGDLALPCYRVVLPRRQGRRAGRQGAWAPG